MTSSGGDGAQSGFSAAVQRIEDNIGQVIKGKPEVIRSVVTCLLAEGHLLIEDVPGTGKTSVARALASSIGGKWGRIQFTPDLLPSDVTGVNVFYQATQTFQFHEGSVFSNIVIADEINRASPKTQSALLEVMEERQVTTDGVARPVPRPFIVVATQNPIEMDGTYRLPEAQLDRFLMRLSIGYPDASAERDILANEDGGRLLRSLQPVVQASDVVRMIERVSTVHINDAVADYILTIAAATRNLPEVRLGVSPRGSLALLRATRVLAAASGRGYGLPEDVKSLAVNVLGHRIILNADAELRGVTAADVIERVLDAVPVPQAAMA